MFCFLATTLLALLLLAVPALPVLLPPPSLLLLLFRLLRSLRLLLRPALMYRAAARAGQNDSASASKCFRAFECNDVISNADVSRSKCRAARYRNERSLLGCLLFFPLAESSSVGRKTHHPYPRADSGQEGFVLVSEHCTGPVVMIPGSVPPVHTNWGRTVAVWCGCAVV